MKKLRTKKIIGFGVGVSSGESAMKAKIEIIQKVGNGPEKSGFH